MLSQILYVSYISLFVLVFTPFVKKGKYASLSMLPLLFFPHFNNLCIIKLGMTFSFFETYLFLLSFLILLTKIKLVRFYKCTISEKIFHSFIGISLISIFIAQFRIAIGNLEPTTYIHETPIIRSLMSLNKLFVFPILLPLVRSFYVACNVNIEFYFKKYLALSGIIPSIAVILQFVGVECMMLFNNPSFSDDIVWKSPGRPFGLTYEASFYALMVFFSFLGVYYAEKSKILSRRTCLILYILYFVGVLLCISRTGMLVFIVFIFIKNYKTINTKKLIIVGIILAVLSNLTLLDFNVLERFSSSFDQDADASTIERFASTYGLLNLALDKSILGGVGIFNYYFYIYHYISTSAINYLDYSKSSVIVAFNMWFQLMAEWGIPLFLYYIISSYKKLKKCKTDGFENDWFLYSLFIAFSVQLLNFSILYIILLYISSKELKAKTCA